ncbi:MAG: glycoside hydrolase [Ruminococcus sp.]|nr:glycoside hydrolase [Ruminococcus sp.]
MLLSKRIMAGAVCFAMAASMCGTGASAENSESTVRTPENTQIDSTVTVKVSNASTTNEGIFQGWGTSLCWWANRLGYSDKLAQDAADLFFGDNGLRFNIMRYNIGGGDAPEHNHITRTDSAVPGWLYWNEENQEYVYDYDADHNQLNVLKRAAEAAGEDAYVEVFSNSPPYFMTNSGCSSGANNANDDNIKDDCYDDFAEYLAHVSSYINNKMGITVNSVSPMNEPNTNYWWAWNWKQEGCHVSPGENQSRLIVETAKAFENAGLSDVEIVGSDETSPQKQITAYESYTEEAKAVIGRISAHTYDTSGINDLGKLAKEEGFNLWMSEVDGSGTAGSNAGEMSSALWLGGKIISDMNALSPSAWVMWQVIDSHISEEGYNGNTDSGMPDTSKGFWGTAVADHDNREIILTQKYYGLGQFTRYIRAGSTIIHCGDSAIAAYSGETNELTIVALNTSGNDKVCNFDLYDLEAIGENVSVVRTSGSLEDGEHWAELEDISAYDEGFVADLKANSITTFTVGGVTLGEGKPDRTTSESASDSSNASSDTGSVADISSLTSETVSANSKTSSSSASEKSTDNPNTGAMGAVGAGIILAGAAAVIFRKKNDQPL